MSASRTLVEYVQHHSRRFESFVIIQQRETPPVSSFFFVFGELGYLGIEVP